MMDHSWDLKNPKGTEFAKAFPNFGKKVWKYECELCIGKGVSQKCGDLPPDLPSSSPARGSLAAEPSVANLLHQRGEEKK